MKNILLTLALLLFSYPNAQAASAESLVIRGNRYLNAGKFDEALINYNEALIKEPNSEQICYNIGLAYLKKAQQEEAISSFEKALLSPEKKLESLANFQIGNAKYYLGKSKENTELEKAVELMRQSLDYYKRTIELDPKNKDAKFNHELVEKELKALLERLKQEQNCPRPDKNNKEEKEEDKKKQEQEQQGQSQEQEKQEEEKEMSTEEAKMLLEGYRQDENKPMKLQDEGNYKEKEVEKDW